MKPVLGIVEALKSKKTEFQESVLVWAANNTPLYPWRQAEKTAYEVLIGEFWLKATNHLVAVPVYHRFLRHFPCLQDLAEAGEDDLAKILDFRLQRQGREAKLMAKGLREEGRGDLPRDSESLARVTGLEQHNIRAVLCFGYGLTVAVIDANAARMLSHIFDNTIFPQPSPGLLKALGESLLCDRRPQEYNRGILEMAEIFCKNQSPLCRECPPAKICDYHRSLLLTETAQKRSMPRRRGLSHGASHASEKEGAKWAMYIH